MYGINDFVCPLQYFSENTFHTNQSHTFNKSLEHFIYSCCYLVSTSGQQQRAPMTSVSCHFVHFILCSVPSFTVFFNTFSPCQGLPVFPSICRLSLSSIICLGNLSFFLGYSWLNVLGCSPPFGLCTILLCVFSFCNHWLIY